MVKASRKVTNPKKTAMSENRAVGFDMSAASVIPPAPKMINCKSLRSAFIETAFGSIHPSPQVDVRNGHFGGATGW